jgi:hypothetical protein
MMASGVSVFFWTIFEGKPGAAVKRLRCDHEVMGSNPGNSILQRKTAYIRSKVIGPFPRPCTSRSYVHRAAVSIFEGEPWRSGKAVAL